ncbi:MAG TPA: hypothetical protein VGQ25_02855 [Gemmatimonadales bacterium]|nr:hypothetical protein [Gemmatimonadales bacterium]
MKRAAGAALCITVLSGCAYYNAMWSAERLAREARRLEAHDREPEARTQWAGAAVKAESVMARHPRSRWADDALVLRAEGLAGAGTCAAAAAPIAKALATVSDQGLHERAGLAAAQCALAANQPVEAERALAEALASDDAQRRSRAHYLAGRAAAARLDYDGAVTLFGRSRESAALPARVRALLAAGRTAAAAATLDTVAATRRFSEAEWAGLLQALAAIAPAPAASQALDRMLAQGRVPEPARARLLIADGDRLLAGGEPDGAVARYRQAEAVAAAAGEAGLARVRRQRALVARAAAPAELAPVIAELTRLSRPDAGGGGAGVAEARRLLDLLARITTPPTAGTSGAAFRTAEFARDSLNALRLAGRLFLDLAAADSGSLFAPKALIAALPLLPDRHDSIVGALDAAYAASPYTRALHGEASVAYAAAEDSLARALGVQRGRAAPAPPQGTRFAGPLTGPRGPWLDDAPVRRVEPAPPSRRRPGAERDRPARPDP